MIRGSSEWMVYLHMGVFAACALFLVYWALRR